MKKLHSSPECLKLIVSNYIIKTTAFLLCVIILLYDCVQSSTNTVNRLSPKQLLLRKQYYIFFVGIFLRYKF